MTVSCVVDGVRKDARRAVAALTAAVLAAAMLAVGVHLTAPLSAASARSDAMSDPPTLAAGFRHACMIRGGKAYCWGDNSGGALGTGSVVNIHVPPTTPPSGGVGTPTPVYTGGVLAGKTLKQVAAGAGFTCALDTDGHAYCWGSNAYGQLGDNSALSSGVPVAVSGGRTFTQISVGYAHTCAVGTDGHAYCWGSNAYGQLGIGSSLPSRSTVPVAVATATGDLGSRTVTQVSADDSNSTCALAAGLAYCWGSNSFGQLGNEPSGCDATNTPACPLSDNSNVPLGVHTPAGNAMAGKSLAQISVGDRHACAIATVASGGTAYCWGTNGSGRLGCGYAVVTTPTADCPPSSGAASFIGKPVAVYTGTSASDPLFGKVLTRISAGFTHVCVVDTTGAASCWGQNSNGQLGCGSACGTGNQAVPVAVFATGTPIAGKSLTEIATGQYLSCALDTLGAAYCWGYAGFGALGNPSIGSNALAPVAVTAPRSTTIAAGNNHSCMIRTGKAYCWGSNNNGQLGCGTPTAGSSTCPTTSNTPVAVSMPVSTTFTQISAGNLFTCALAHTGVAYCWGANSSGQLGDNSTTQRNTPVAVTGASPPTGVLSGKVLIQISAGNAHACAIDTTGAAYCWGLNDDNRLGCGTTPSATCTTGPNNVPRAVSASSSPMAGKVLVQVSAGYTHTCALDTAGAAYCWGSNSNGQLGCTGSPAPGCPGVGSNVNAPRAVFTGTGGTLSGKAVASIAAGNLFTCALDSTGAAYCWGAGGSGQLGNSTTTASQLTPVAVTTAGTPMAGASLAQITLGQSHACALDTTGKAYCWGLNNVGQLGWTTGTTVARVPGVPEMGGNAIELSGNGEYVELPKGIVSGLNEFTISAWVNPAENRGWSRVFDFGSGMGVNMFLTLNAYNPLRFAITVGGGNAEQTIDGSGSPLDSNGQLALNTWSHVAVTLSRNTVTSGYTGRLYVNGQDVGENANMTLTPADLGVTTQNWIGRSQYGADPFAAAIIDDFRIYNTALSSSQIGDLYAGREPTDVAPNALVAHYKFDESSGATALDSSGNGRNATIISIPASSAGSSVPVEVTTSGVLSGVILTQVSSEFETTCTQGGSGALYCWGLGTDGQVGNDSTLTFNMPVPVVSPGAPGNVAAFQDNRKAIVYWTPPALPSGATVTGYTATVYFGLNTSTYPNTVSCDTTGATTCTINGLLNPPVPPFPAPAPAPPFPLINGVSYAVTVVAHTNFAGGMDSVVSGMATVTPWWPANPTITAGASHGCTISVGRAYCWGDNTHGQLGDGSTTASKVPVPVSGLSGKTLVEISAGAQHTCALDNTGAAYCWGDNTHGQLGDGSTTASNVPVAIVTQGVPSGAPLAQISVGSRHTCALGSDGAAYCWGYGADGELGNGSDASSDVPVAVTHDTGPLYGKVVTRVTAGDSHTCVLDFDGVAYCWGGNTHGQLGNGSTTPSNVPVPVTGLAGKMVTQISAGTEFTCAADSTGVAYCWGSNSNGQLGCGTPGSGACPGTGSFSGVPVAVTGTGPSGKVMVKVSAGAGFACALDSTGAAWCWGSNSNGQLGCGTPGSGTCPGMSSFSGVPVGVTTVGTAMAGKFLDQVDAGSSDACAQDIPAGTVYCWGQNTSGQLGNDTFTDATEGVPVSPQAPATPAATTSDSNAVISWNVPGFLNTGTPTGYTVTAAPPPGSGLPILSCSTSGSLPPTTCTITGLTPGITYELTVTLHATINGVQAPSTSAPVTFRLVGFLTITVPDTASLGSATPGDSVSGPLGTITVYDDRGADAGSWTVAVSATDFTSDGNAIPATAATYTPGTVTATPAGVVTVTTHNITLSGAPQTVVAATGAGDNSAEWDPTISVAVPRTAVTGTYTATITHSVT